MQCDQIRNSEKAMRMAQISYLIIFWPFEITQKGYKKSYTSYYSFPFSTLHIPQAQVCNSEGCIEISHLVNSIFLLNDGQKLTENLCEKS